MPSESSSPDEECVICGHWRDLHNGSGSHCAVCHTKKVADDVGDAFCRHDFSPRHPADAETAGESKAYTCAVSGGACKRLEDCTYGCREAADDLTRLGQEMEHEPECSHEAWEVTGEQRTPNGWLKWRKCADCRESLPNLIEAEPHWPKCRDCGDTILEGCTWCQGCVPPEAAPPRRPPYAVAYATEDGSQYEVALPGDATIRAVDGALIITHASAVQALTMARPMEGA